MTSKEKYINNQFENCRTEYHEIKEKLDALSLTCNGTLSNVHGLSTTYATLSETLSDMKSTMENHGSSMTDTSPLVNIKSSLTSLKTEVSNFELRIGIVG